MPCFRHFLRQLRLHELVHRLRREINPRLAEMRHTRHMDMDMDMDMDMGVHVSTDRGVRASIPL